jgi:hypothetical protein
MHEANFVNIFFALILERWTFGANKPFNGELKEHLHPTLANTPFHSIFCSQILLLSDINGPFYSGHFPLKADLDNDYYLFRCEDINGLWMLKRTFMTFVGGDSVIKRYSIIK